MGQQLTPASDVYALGVVLHEMLTGWHPPRDPASAWRLAPFDPRTHEADVPEPIAAAVVQATQPDPEARFATAGALLAALNGVEPADPPPPAATAPVPQPTATMAITPPERPTVVLTQASEAPPPASARRVPESVRSRWPHLAVLMLVVGVLVVSAAQSADGVNFPASTVPAAPPTTVPKVAPTTTVPPAPAFPPAPAPEEGGGGDNDNGNDGGNNGNGKAKGKKDD